MRVRPRERAGGVRQVTNLEVHPGVFGNGNSLAEAVNLFVGLFALGLVCHSKVGEDPDHPQQPVLLVFQRPTEQCFPLLRRAAVSAQSGIDLQVHAGGTLQPPCLGHHVGQFPAGDAEVHAQLDGGREIARFCMQPRKNGRFNARPAQLHGFRDVCNAQPRGTCFQCRLRHRDSTVSVAVGLHHSHDAGRARNLGDMPNVVPHGGKVDVHPPLRHGPC